MSRQGLALEGPAADQPTRPKDRVEQFAMEQARGPLDALSCKPRDAIVGGAMAPVGGCDGSALTAW